MDMNETLQIIGLMLAPAFFSLLGMAGIGSPAIAVLGEISAKARKKVFYDKYGQQAGAMGLILLIFLIVIHGATIGLGMARFPQLIQQNITPSSPFFAGTIGMGIFAAFGLIYFLGWKKMRNTKPLHIFLGLIAALAGLAAVAIVTPAKLTFNLSQGSPSQEALAQIAIMGLPMAVMYALLVLSAAAALSLTYLVIRRNKDDFGRDYYNFSLRLAARWAALPMIGFIGCQGWLFATLTEKIKTLVLGTPLAYVWGGLTILGVACSVIWIIIARSESPLRLKGLAFLAVALFWLAQALNATLFVNFMTML